MYHHRMLLKSWNLYDIVLYKNVEPKQIWMSKEFDTNICNPCVPNRYRRKISPAFVFYDWRWGYVWRIYQRMLSDKTLQMHKTWLLFYFILTRAFEIIYLDFEISIEKNICFIIVLSHLLVMKHKHYCFILLDTHYAR